MQLVFCFNRDDAIQETMAEYMSAMKAIEPNSTILPLCFVPWGTTLKRKPVSVRFQPFSHAAGQVAAERWALNLLNTRPTTLTSSGCSSMVARTFSRERC